MLQRLALAMGLLVLTVGVAAAGADTRSSGPALIAQPVPAPVTAESRALAAQDVPDPFVPARTTPVGPAAALPTGTWKPLGPAPIGPPYLVSGGYYGGANSGRVTGVVVLPGGLHPGRVVLGTAGGGVWTSDNSGQSWTPRTDGKPDLAIGAVAVDPANANHVLAGTGEANQSGDSYHGDGILVSADGGTTWTLQNPGGVFSALSIAQLAVVPGQSSHEFAATSSGLYMTTNGGTSWAKPSDASYASVDGNITAVAVNPTSSSVVLIAGGAKTVARSSDGGVHWAAANAGIATPGSYPLVALAIAKSNPSVVYAGVGSYLPVAVYRSTNGGSSWTPVTAPDYTGQGYAYGVGTSEQGWYDNALAVDPTNASHVLAGGIAAVETTNGGTTWRNVNGQSFYGGAINKIHPDQHAFAFQANGQVWIGDDGGAYLYTPSTHAVANANANLNITQFYFGFNVVNGSVLAGSQDNASARTPYATATPWTAIWAGDGGPSQITPNYPALQFVESNGDLAVTTDSFASNLQLITPPQYGLFTPPMIVIRNTTTPTSPTVLYGGRDLWRTTNPTAVTPTWTAVTSEGHYVSAISVSTTNPNIVYVGFADGTIEVSTNNGVSFTPIALAPSSQSFVTGISVNPANAKAITASFSSNDTRYYPGLPHVAQYAYTAAPGAGVWTTITGDLPSAAVSHVVYDAGALIAATDIGVYGTAVAAGSSTHWLRIGTGLPNVQVQDLEVVAGAIYTVTHGRGAWRMP
jgi:hypothetical protein